MTRWVVHGGIRSRGLAKGEGGTSLRRRSGNGNQTTGYNWRQTSREERCTDYLLVRDELSHAVEIEELEGRRYLLVGEFRWPDTAGNCFRIKSSATRVVVGCLAGGFERHEARLPRMCFVWCSWKSQHSSGRSGPRAVAVSGRSRAREKYRATPLQRRSILVPDKRRRSRVSFRLKSCFPALIACWCWCSCVGVLDCGWSSRRFCRGRGAPLLLSSSSSVSSVLSS